MEDLKKEAARVAAGYVKDGMRLGLGTGSTATYFIQFVGQKVKEEGIKVEAIATSSVSENQARELGIPLMDKFPRQMIDLTVDGADEIDPDLNLVKGLGGALLMEKIVAARSKMEIIIADESKLVSALGTKSPIPVEVVKFGYEATQMELEKIGLKPRLRMKKGSEEAFITDQGNYILDCYTSPLSNVPDTAQRIKSIIGVVDHGLFVGLAHKAVIATRNGIKEM